VRCAESAHTSEMRLSFHASHADMRLLCFSLLPPLTLPPAAFFVGGVPRLRKDGPVYETATEDRNKMTTKSMGKITVDVSVMTRHFSDISIDGVR
jgi:hypothetical protein